MKERLLLEEEETEGQRGSGFGCGFGRKMEWEQNGCSGLVSKGEGDGGTVRVSKMKACAGKGVRLEEENQKRGGRLLLKKKMGLGLGFFVFFS